MSKTDWKEFSRFSNADDSPGFQLWKMATRWRRAIEGTLKPFGLTHPQFVLLAATTWLRNGTLPMQADIARFIELDVNTVSQIIKGLERRGLIIRERGKDERTKHPCLTDEGLSLLRQALPAVEKADARFFAPILRTNPDGKEPEVCLMLSDKK